MAPVNLRGSFVAALIVGQLFLPLHTLPVQAEPVVNGQAQSAEQAQQSSSSEVGYATYYAKRYNGKRTTSGVRYRPGKLTAAHSTLPFGSRVKVVNPSNGKEVVVTVNDRCKQRKQQHIDLSFAAAKKIGIYGKGMVRVQIIPLEDTAG
jgi:rare lipoprotein A